MARQLPQTQPGSDPQVRALTDLGTLVRNARAHSRLRIDDAASFIGVSADLLSRLENGKPVTTERLLKVLDGLGLDLLVVPRSQTLAMRDAVQKASE